MYGKGRAVDSAFIERSWRSVKYEKLYLDPPKDGVGLYLLLVGYFNYYNTRRRYKGIDKQIPEKVYYNLTRQAAK